MDLAGGQRRCGSPFLLFDSGREGEKTPDPFIYLDEFSLSQITNNDSRPLCFGHRPDLQSLLLGVPLVRLSGLKEPTLDLKRVRVHLAGHETGNRVRNAECPVFFALSLTRLICSLPWDNVPYSSARLLNVTHSSWNQVDMTMMDGLTCDFANVDPNIETGYGGILSLNSALCLA